VTTEILSLPMFPELREDEIETVVSALKEFFTSDVQPVKRGR
jgi:dTDP-4-amino-4,6-dideoxygalactose transaminase